MFGLIIFFIFAIGLFRDYGKWLCVTVIWLPFLTAISLWGQNVTTFLSCLACVLFFFKMQKKPIHEPFPLLISFLLIGGANLVTNYFAEERHTPTMISNLLNICLIVVFFFRTFLSDKERLLPIFMRCSVVFSVIVGFYSVFETVTSSNPFMETMLSNGWINYDKLVTDVRFGMKRSQGIFTMHGTNGAVATEMFVVLLGGLLSGLVKKTKFNYLIIASLLFTVFASGTRSAILSLVICSFTYLNMRILNFKRLLGVSLVVIVFYVAFSSYFDDIIRSFVDTESVGGSNKDMRQGQFDIALMFLLQSPVFGHGIGYCATHVMGVYNDMFGAESLWFPVMIDTGLLGLTGYALFFISCMIYCIKKRMPYLIFFVLGFLALNSMSSIPGFIITWIFPVLIVLMQIDSRKNLNH